MSSAAIDGRLKQASQWLMALREQGVPGPCLPEPLKPASIQDGWRVQQAVSALRAARGEALAGWKCSLPREPGQWPMAALHAGPAWPAPALRVEPEFAFVMARGLPPRAAPYTPAEVMAAVGAVHLALELIGSRFADPASAGAPELLADGLFNAGWVLGPRVTTPLPEVPAFELTMAGDGEAPRTLPARHPDGDPRRPLVWLAGALNAQGLGLEAGQAVITGSLAGVLEWPGGQVPADAVTLAFGPYGAWRVPRPWPRGA